MKKFLLLAAMGLVSTSAAFAADGPLNNCLDCGDESATSEDITVCAGVRVPICLVVEDGTLTFPCLRRPLASYATHHTDGYSDSSNVNPCDVVQQASNTAKVRIQGDADDEVFIGILQAGNVVGCQLNLQHVNTAAQYSTGPHQLVPGGALTGTGTNPDYLTVTLSACVSQFNNSGTTNRGDVADQNPLDFPVPVQTTPYAGPSGWAVSPGRLAGPNTTVANSFTLSHNDGSGFAGTGGLYVWFGGSVRTQAGQQRGQYGGAFKVYVAYAQ